MKRVISCVLLMLVLTSNAFALEVPTDTVVQNLNGSQQAIKTFTVSPEQDPAALIEEPFELEGYLYTFADIVKSENPVEEKRIHTEVITVETTKDDLALILEQLKPTIEYDDGRFQGIFDEIQECPEALNTLKYFKEKANEYHVIAAGSLLGTLLAKPKSYPVGMVNLLDIYPLTFDEFLEATDPGLYAYYESIEKEQPIEEIFHNRLLEAYNYYLIIGGMPECVSSWIKYKDPAKVSQIQRELIEVYENDFSKHNGKVNSGRILMVFRSIVAQLAKPNEKFMYGAVREGGRARDFEEAIEWLVSAGMLNRVYNVSKMEHPLSAFDKLDQFKLFVFDTGLLKHMAGIDNAAVLLKTDYQFKGPLTENYVLQQLRGQFEVEPRYYSDKNSEIDFVLQNGMEIIPIEAKGGEDKSAPSFKKYVADHKPEHAFRFSKRGYRKDGDFTNLPLYLARKTKELL